MIYILHIIFTLFYFFEEKKILYLLREIYEFGWVENKK